METSDTKLPFLDILILKTGRKITTDIFYKPTDTHTHTHTHQYLNFQSSHPSHTKRNIPYCMARRICAIVSDNTIREIRLNELKTYLTQQSYPEGLIKCGINKAKQLTFQELRTPKIKETDTKAIPFVSTHDPRLPNVFNTIKSNLPLLHQSELMKQLVQEGNLIYSRRQPKNLKKHLTRARFESQQNEFSIKSCGDSRCGVCGKKTIYI